MNLQNLSKSIINFLKHTFKTFHKSLINFIENDGIEEAGYIAFLMIFSLFPIMILITFILSLMGETILGLEFVDLIIQNAPKEIVDTIVPKLQEIVNNPSTNILSLAFLSILWTTSSFVEGLRGILNKIYKVKDKPHYLLRRMLSILQFFMISITMIVAVLGLVVAPKVMHKINSLLLNNGYEINILWQHIRGVLMYLILFIMIALIYYLIPNKKQKIEYVLPGALVTLIGWTISGKLFALYLKNFNEYNLLYGSLGGVIISLIFFHIVAIILVYGAEFNYYFGDKIVNKIEETLKKL